MRPPIFARDEPPEPCLEHEIRLHAYDLYLQRGQKDGHALDDWLEAERAVIRGKQRLSFDGDPRHPY